MAVEILHDQASMKECVGHGDRTRGRLHANLTPSDRATINGVLNFGKKIILVRKYCC